MGLNKGSSHKRGFNSSVRGFWLRKSLSSTFSQDLFWSWWKSHNMRAHQNGQFLVRICVKNLPFWNSPKGLPARGVLMVHYWDMVDLTLLPVVVLSGTRKHGTTHMLRTDVAYGLGVIKFAWKKLETFTADRGPPAYRHPILTHSKEVRTFTWDRPLCQCPLRVVSNFVCRVHSR